MELKHFTKVEEGGKEKFCRRKCKQVGRRIWRRRNRIKTFYKNRRRLTRRTLQKQEQASGQGGAIRGCKGNCRQTRQSSATYTRKSCIFNFLIFVLCMISISVFFVLCIVYCKLRKMLSFVLCVSFYCERRECNYTGSYLSKREN